LMPSGCLSKLEKIEFGPRVIERFWNYRMMRTREPA
jgi:hypothetical protein